MSELFSLYCLLFILLASAGVAFALAWRCKKECERTDYMVQYILAVMIQTYGYDYMEHELDNWKKIMKETGND